MGLTHVNSKGHLKMVDITRKKDTNRLAEAKGSISMRHETLKLVIDNSIPKGNVLTAAQVAGIMAAKQVPDLIPLCHPLLLTKIEVDFTIDVDSSRIEITATACNSGKTGTEMEALTAVSVAALTIYDMVKAVDRTMHIDNIRLVRKSGGKSGEIILE